MDSWKRILLKSFGAGAGIATILAVAAGFFVWHNARREQGRQQDRPWNAQALKADYTGLGLSADGADKTKVRFYFDVQNNTNEDYRLDATPAVRIMRRLKHTRSLSDLRSDFGGEEPPIQLAQPVFLPARDRSRLSLVASYEFPFLPSSPGFQKKTHDFFGKAFSDTEGFVLFDDVRRYRIEFQIPQPLMK